MWWLDRVDVIVEGLLASNQIVEETLDEVFFVDVLGFDMYQICVILIVVWMYLLS